MYKDYYIYMSFLRCPLILVLVTSFCCFGTFCFFPVAPISFSRQITPILVKLDPSSQISGISSAPDRLLRSVDLALEPDGNRVSDSLSERELDSVRRMLSEREKEARKDNIIIRGWDIEGKNDITRKRVEEFIKEKLGVETKVW